MDGSSSQPRTDPPTSPINAFPIEELYTPEFLESLQANTGYWQAPNTYEAAALLGGFKRSSEMARNSTSKIFNRVWGSKRHKSSGSSSFNIESEETNINLNTNVGDNDEDEVDSETTAQEKEERLAFLDIKRREVECRG
ncbi:hypothetical protein Tco_1201234 [Tanacetum coccineum]